MTESSASRQINSDALSLEKQELLALLRSRKSRRIDRIPRYPRSSDDEPVRVSASSGQRRLWFIEHMLGDVIAGYQIPIALRLHGPLDPQIVEKALNTIVQRADMLRTVFVSEEAGLYQEVVDGRPFSLQHVDLSGSEPARREEDVLHHKLEEVRTKFDLRYGPLVRGRLLRLQETEHVLLVTLHHIIVDGWSIRVFIRELAELYSAYRAGEPNPLEPLPIQYADYVHWQREQSRQGRGFERQLRYWVQHLEGAAARLDLPTDRPRPEVQSYRGANVVLTLDEALTTRLKTFAKEQGVTLFMALYAGWAILLSRLSG